MLSWNVAELLRATPGTYRDYPLDVERLPIAEDLTTAAPVRGKVRLASTGRGILARGHLTTALPETCSRCLTAMVSPVEVDLEEEALPSIDIDTGHPVDMGSEPEALRLDGHHELDLTDAVREAISLAEPIVVLCRPDCRGLCNECGADLNTDPTHHHGEADLDPRLAALAVLRDRLDHPDDRI
ncbi:MAG: DUF177 domain-containing protein [Chloroflexi bacterium]|nr:DUF177 domain-containing protein [Chloroflexota bacterium]